MKTDKIKKQTALEYRRRVCMSMDFISRNLDKDLSLEEISHSAAFSTYHFHRVFKAVVGETVASFTRRLRLEQAANRLLLQQDQDITSIALDYGFSSSQNFAKAFNRQFGMSPSEYRNRKTGNIQSNGGNALSLLGTYDFDKQLANATFPERSNDMKTRITQIPEYKVAYVRKLGPYGKEIAEAAFGELMQWAGPKGLAATGEMFGVYWDNPEVTAPDKCRTDACISIPQDMTPDGPVAVQTIGGGNYAICHFEIKTDSFQSAWDDAFAWLVQSGHECDDKPTFERYHQTPEQHPEGKWVFDICIPLK